MTAFAARKRLRSVLTSLEPFSSTAKRSVSSRPTMSVVSWNILTKDFSEKHYYPYVEKKHREWESHRLPKVLSTINSFASDVVCLQECDVASFRRDFAEILDLDDSVKSEDIDTISVTAKRDAISSAGLSTESGAHTYKHIMDVRKAGTGTMPPVTLYRANRLKEVYSDFRSRAIITLFQLRTTPPMAASPLVFVVNVHLDATKWYCRFSQLRSILSRIHSRLAAVCQLPSHLISNGLIPVLICGDFNEDLHGVCRPMLTEPSLDLMQFMAVDILKCACDCHSAHFDHSTAAHSSHCCNCAEEFAALCKAHKLPRVYRKPMGGALFEDCYAEEQWPTFNSEVRGAFERLDFLYHTHVALCTEIRETLPRGIAAANVLLPNDHWVSDHLAIGARFQLALDQCLPETEELQQTLQLLNERLLSAGKQTDGKKKAKKKRKKLKKKNTF